jgi:hypothetical protein
MVQKIYVAAVKEENYPALLRIGDASEFPERYEEFLLLVERRRKEFRELGYHTQTVFVDPDELRCARARQRCATYGDLLRYAAKLFNPRRK